ncbi:MAG TPA: cysteine desulfurase family protein [Acidimicrobiales bacterium]|nr:cysteine desulfurase family protein [Acidimicrobiales bacterium]
MIYLDHASTTPLRPEVLEVMTPWLTNEYGNPSGGHSVSRSARRALDDARDVIAAALGGQPGEVVFTSGGTEADNLAITGAVLGARSRASLPGPAGATGAAGGRTAAVACTAVEHPAVLEPVKAAGGRVLGVDADGLVDLEALAGWLAASGGGVAEVSVMVANNETGALQPLAAVAELVRQLAPEALVHTDAVQALPWSDLVSAASVADLVTISSHKVGGPKGAGALLVRSAARSRLQPVLRGGPQENELRAGTPDVAAIVGMAEAVRLTVAERQQRLVVAGDLGKRLVREITAAVAGAAEAVAAPKRLATICNLSFEGIESEELLVALDQLGVCASAGSACASGALDPSHVLVAMGRSQAEARTHVRFSLGYSTTADEIEEAVGRIRQAVEGLRERSR